MRSQSRRSAQRGRKPNCGPRSLALESLEPRRLLALTGLPQLDSLSEAPNTIYLDFDSQTFAPKEGSRAGQTVTLDPFDFDGNVGSISSTEADMVRDIHARMAEDFAPFNVNVTTVDPDSAASQADPNKLWRVAFSSHWSDAGFANGSSGAIGVIPGVPVVWTRYIGDNTAQHASTASHELGHKFALKHHHGVDANNNVLLNTNEGPQHEYGNGPTGDDWAPIMGNNLSSKRTIWARNTTIIGTTPKLQDDIQTIATTLGYRADDHGNHAQTATDLRFISAAAPTEVNGVISATSDQDVFSFEHPGGWLDMEVHGLEGAIGGSYLAANLDAQLELRNGNGGPVVSRVSTFSDPANSLDASLRVHIPEGVYTAVVSSHGDYGDVGHYTLTLTTYHVQPDRFDDQQPIGELRNDTLANAAVIPGAVPADAGLFVGGLKIDNLTLDSTYSTGDIDFFTVQLDVPQNQGRSLPDLGIPGEVVFVPSEFSVYAVPDEIVGATRPLEITVYKGGLPYRKVTGSSVVISDPYNEFSDGKVTFSVRDPAGVNYYSIDVHHNADMSHFKPKLLYEVPPVRHLPFWSPISDEHFERILEDPLFDPVPERWLWEAPQYDETWAEVNLPGDIRGLGELEREHVPYENDAADALFRTGEALEPVELISCFLR